MLDTITTPLGEYTEARAEWAALTGAAMWTVTQSRPTGLDQEQDIAITVSCSRCNSCPPYQDQEQQEVHAMPDDQPVFRPIPQPKELTSAEKQAKWEAKQRKKRPGFRYVVLNPHVPYEKKG